MANFTEHATYFTYEPAGFNWGLARGSGQFYKFSVWALFQDLDISRAKAQLENVTLHRADQYPAIVIKAAGFQEMVEDTSPTEVEKFIDGAVEDGAQIREFRIMSPLRLLGDPLGQSKEWQQVEGMIDRWAPGS